MSQVFGRSGLLSAAMAAAMMGGSLLHSTPSFTPSVAAAWTPRGSTRGTMRLRTPGRHRAAGSKLARKASEGKLGLRW